MDAETAISSQRSATQKRALLITTADQMGGTEQLVITLTGGLRAQGWRVRTVFPRSSTSGTLVAWAQGRGVAVEAQAVVPRRLARRSTRDILALRCLVRECHPDVVNLHFADIFASFKDVLAVRLAGNYRCVLSFNHPQRWDEVGEHKRRATRLATRLAHDIVVISHATRERLLEIGVPERKIHLIPCGIPIPRKQPPRAEARARLGLPANAFVISSLARLVPDKGISDLIEAVIRVTDPGSDLVVVIAGDGPERAKLEHLAAIRLGSRAVFLGRVADTSDVYAAADIFVLPSHMEGFGLVFVEAAFHGVPSIATRVGGIPDAIADGITGLLVPPGDPDVLASAIQRLRGDPEMRQRLGAAAQARAHRDFTEARMAERYSRLFLGLKTDV